MDSQKSIRVDDSTSTLTYVGDAAIGVSESAAVWRIKRLQTTGTVLKITWADGNEFYDNIWADRASLTYT
jgi:hypothetical protein